MSFSIHFVKIDLYVYHLGPPTPPLLLKNVKTALQATLVSVKIPVTIWKENRAKTSGLKYIGIAFL